MADSSPTLSVVTIGISALSLFVSGGSFAWQHLRKVDSVVCTLVANECNEKRAAFQFSFANLGTRPTLVRDVVIKVFKKPELNGSYEGEGTVVAGSLPQVIKAGEMCSVSLEVSWSVSFLVEALKESEQRGGKFAQLFFVGSAVCWNPKGERMRGEKQLATFDYNPKDGSSKYECPPFDRSFALKKTPKCF